MSCGIWQAILAGVVSESCILAMKKLGAICALMLIHGIYPEPAPLSAWLLYLLPPSSSNFPTPTAGKYTKKKHRIK